MTIKVNVVLPEPVYDQFQQLAHQQRLEIAEAIATYLTQNPPVVAPNPKVESQPDPQLAAAIAQEKQAYLRLHSQLWESYPGQYVAIADGQLVYHDVDKVALYTRIEQRYLNQFVLMRRIEREPERLLQFRSPRFIERP